MILKNPILNKEVGPIRDPMIINDDGVYYMVGTSPEFWEGYNPGVRLWRSENLVDWQELGRIIDRDNISEDKPFRDRFWAPELFKHKNKYYCLFNAHNLLISPLSEGLRSYVAVADCVTGPYKIIEKPLIDKDFTTNDAHLFADDDGRVYLFYTTGDAIYYNEFDTESCTVSDDAHLVIEKGTGDEWDSIGIEGSFVIKRDGKYYHWYSSWTRSYEMGLAVTDDLSKPFTKCENNPVISGVGVETTMPYCGHNSCFTLNGGGDAIAFHASGEGFCESLCINNVTYPVTKRQVPATEFEF